jgi:hypothetical protein
MGEEAIPTLHELRAASQLARTLATPQTERATAREAFRSVPGGGLFRARDFETGEEILRSVGLIILDGEMIVRGEGLPALAASAAGAPGLLLGLRLRHRPPAWLQTAAGGQGLRPELIPDADLAAIEEVCGAEALRTAILTSTARHHGVVELDQLAESGEAFVAECCRGELADRGVADLAAAVTQVHSIDPDCDYSILAPRLDGYSSRRIAVKTTRRLAWRGEISLSRSEFEYGSADPDWTMAVVAVDREGVHRPLGWCRAADLAARVPRDPHPMGRWDRVRILQAEGVLQPGLPPAEA